MHRIRYLAVSLLGSGAIYAWQTPAPAAKDTFFYNTIFRTQVRYKSALPFFETNYRIENENQGNPRIDGTANTSPMGLTAFRQQTWHATIGSYYNVIPNLMVGGFYRYSMGERHRNDWISSGWNSGTWDWFWLNTNNRPDHSFIGDITWRQLLPFLPGENWVFELKNRIQYTWYTDDRYAARDNWGQSSANVAQTKYILRPGLQYFWLKDDSPFITFFLQYEAHFALNYGNRRLVESWGYFGFFYHVTEAVALGINIARAQWWWSESDSIKNVRAQEMCNTTVGSTADTACRGIQYTATQRAFVLGMTAMMRFDFTPIE
ncbi:MAG: hypothetical protein LDLANPLL_01900 [Turneriella sp.]|nr:hypothetical protein [Turneriella sp.]